MAALPLGRVGEDGKAALRGARQACSFDVRAMTYVLNGGKGITHRREEVAAKVREGACSAGLCVVPHVLMQRARGVGDGRVASPNGCPHRSRA